MNPRSHYSSAFSPPLLYPSFFLLSFFLFVSSSYYFLHLLFLSLLYFLFLLHSPRLSFISSFPSLCLALPPLPFILFSPSLNFIISLSPFPVSLPIPPSSFTFFLCPFLSLAFPLSHPAFFLLSYFLLFWFSPLYPVPSSFASLPVHLDPTSSFTFTSVSSSFLLLSLFLHLSPSSLFSFPHPLSITPTSSFPPSLFFIHSWCAFPSSHFLPSSWSIWRKRVRERDCGSGGTPVSNINDCHLLTASISPLIRQ